MYSSTSDSNELGVIHQTASKVRTLHYPESFEWKLWQVWFWHRVMICLAKDNGKHRQQRSSRAIPSAASVHMGALFLRGIMLAELVRPRHLSNGLSRIRKKSDRNVEMRWFGDLKMLLFEMILNLFTTWRVTLVTLRNCCGSLWVNRWILTLCPLDAVYQSVARKEGPFSKKESKDRAAVERERSKTLTRLSWAWIPLDSILPFLRRFTTQVELPTDHPYHPLGSSSDSEV